MVGTRRVKWRLELNSQGHRLGYTCIVQSLSFQVKKLGTDKICPLWQEDLGIYEEVYLKLGETGGRERHKVKFSGMQPRDPRRPWRGGGGGRLLHVCLNPRGVPRGL